MAKSKKPKKTKAIKPVLRKNMWELYPELPGAHHSMRKQLQGRRRHKAVRYLLFRLRTLAEQGKPLPDTFDDVFLPPGFLEHFLTQQIERVELPTKQRATIVEGAPRTPFDIGGVRTFASRWDVDPDLVVYSRHRSVWSEWNDTLRRVTPVLGEDEG